MGTNVFDELSYCVCRKVPRKAETIDFLPVAVRKCPLLADADSASQVLLHSASTTLSFFVMDFQSSLAHNCNTMAIGYCDFVIL